MMLKGMLRALTDLVFPPRCVFCNSVVSVGRQVCGTCEKQNPRIGFMKYMNIPQAGKTISCTVPYSYCGQVRQSIIRFKFQNQKQLASFFAQQVAEQVNTVYPDVRFHLVTSVPISAKRLKTRGYNQSERIGVPLAALLGVPYRDCLTKNTDNREQHRLSEKERRFNVRGVYAPLEPKIFEGKSILLIDDIVTTGATLSECALVLLQNGAESVCCAAVAEVE